MNEKENIDRPISRSINVCAYFHDIWHISVR